LRFYFAAFVSGDVIFTKRPIAEHVLEQCINSMLPGRLTGNRPISELNWLSAETDPYFVKNQGAL